MMSSESAGNSLKSTIFHMKFYEGYNFTLTRSLKDALFDQFEYFFKYHVLVFLSNARKEIFLKKFNRVRIDFLAMK